MAPLGGCRGAAVRFYPAVVFVLAMAASWALPADAYQPVLHEIIPQDDGEDLALAVTTAEGDLPAAIETRSGIVRAPETQRAPTSSETAYREPLLPNAPAAFRPDRDTRRPNMVHYEDPFSPSIAPYKRLRAFDAVGPDYTLHVRDTSLTRVPAGGTARVGDEEFYADLTLDFASSSTVLIPSVGPGSRVLAQHTTPAVPVEIWRDGADNWYAKVPGAQRGRVHLVMQVAISRAAFGGSFSMPSWSSLGVVAPLPAGPARAFAKVRDALGLGRSLSPAENVERLVAYFRAFTASDHAATLGDLPRTDDDIYLDLTLSQKGVCRHRAFAFLVTALGLGIPARMVLNEAHAWVEVQTDRSWQRIDLGGAAGDIEEGLAESSAVYEPPPDGFGWPPSAENGSGRAVAMRGREERSARAESSAAMSSSVVSGSRAASPSTAPSAVATGGEAITGASDDRSRTRLLVQSADAQVHRGSAVHISGKVDADGAACSFVRVDIGLRSAAVKSNLGSLVTDAAGSFDGNLYLPIAFPVGDYEVTVSTPGDGRCSPGSSGG
jgi:transglutaminase-like putative cysteine protease